MSSAKWRPSGLGFNALNEHLQSTAYYLRCGKHVVNQWPQAMFQAEIGALMAFLDLPVTLHKLLLIESESKMLYGSPVRNALRRVRL